MWMSDVESGCVKAVVQQIASTLLMAARYGKHRLTLRTRVFACLTSLHPILMKLSSIIECCDTVRERKKRVIRGSPETAYQLTFDWLS